jgi:hypothetical protein
MKDLFEVVRDFATECSLVYKGCVVSPEDIGGAAMQWGESKTGLQLWLDNGSPSKLDIFGSTRLGGCECCISINLAGINPKTLSDAIGQIPMFLSLN